MGTGALSRNLTSGLTAIGVDALFDNTDGFRNTAAGTLALTRNIHADDNTAVGSDALLNNDSSGNGTANGNTAVGSDALRANVNGADNTAVGFNALAANIGGANVAVGENAAAANTIGAVNTAVGSLALSSNHIGTENTAVGRRALENLDGGHENTAVGWGAGANYTGTEFKNICIGDGVSGMAAESNNIRIGDNLPSAGIVVGSNPGINAVLVGIGLPPGGFSIVQTLLASTIQIGPNLNNLAGATCFVGGITGNTVNNQAVVRTNTATGQLGTVLPSSARFKKDIKPMDTASESILALRPVTFHYKEDNTKTLQFGLIAEEVVKVDPSLVVNDREGKPLSVLYEDINIRLLNEFLKEHRKNEEQEVTIARLQKQIEALTAGLQKVSAQLEVSKPTAHTVANNQ